MNWMKYHNLPITIAETLQLVIKNGLISVFSIFHNIPEASLPTLNFIKMSKQRNRKKEKSESIIKCSGRIKETRSTYSIWLLREHNFSPVVIKFPDQRRIARECFWCCKILKNKRQKVSTIRSQIWF